ncbi:transcription elongation factor A protein-like 5 [Prionailurus iriomotensis]
MAQPVSQSVFRSVVVGTNPNKKRKDLQYQCSDRQRRENLNMEKVYKENERKPENEGNFKNEGKPEDEVEIQKMKENQMRKKSWKWRGSQGMRESSRMRDSQMMRDNQKTRKSKKSRASLKMRENHTVRASQNPWQRLRVSRGLPKSAQLKIMCLGKQKEKRTGGQTIPPRTIRRTFRKGTWAVRR